MARTTITRHKCDGCGTVLASPGDGLVILGAVYAADDCDVPLVGHKPGGDGVGPRETALCWPCWHKHVRDKVLAESREAESRASDALWEHDPGRSSGPLPPPELPHAVGVVRALAGVRGDDG